MPAVADRQPLALFLRRFHALSFASFATVALLTLLTLLAGCGGGEDAPNLPEGSGAAPSLSGTVAVGAPIANAWLRILDATGTVVAADLPVDADGKYAAVVLTGPAPYRLEACGYAGPHYLCVYAVAGGEGTANITPLTTATMLLASGQDPASLMSGPVSGLGAAEVAAAQAQLQASLGGVMASAGLSGSFDFVSGALDAGSRGGYDKLLDAVGVRLGSDGQAFVQITPRLGDGNLYLEKGSSSGTLTAAAGASALQLSGLETLFADMSEALVSPAACAADATGIRRSLAAGAQLSMGRGSALGRDAVALALCTLFAEGDESGTPMWGATLLSPTLGRCDLSAAVPLCSVSFVLKDGAGDIVPVGNGMGVTQEANVWKFVGDLLPVSIHVSAKAQRSKRIDSATPVFEYDRALAFEVAAAPGLACARVEQRHPSGTLSTLAFYKRHPGAIDQERLALFTADGSGTTASLDPLVGATRSGDDTWLTLPQGSEGDAVIRSFYRVGRTVVVTLDADAACSTAFAIGGRSSYEVEVEGVPPVWSALASLPWPELEAASATALRGLAIDALATGTFHAAWAFPRGPLGLNGTTVCGSRADCGQGGMARIGEAALRPSATAVSIALRNPGPVIGADDPKTLALYGRNREGVDLQSNYSSCPGVAAGEACH
ncbi:MAG: hypothetical protein ABI699_09535 [Caldimonas sp.]